MSEDCFMVRMDPFSHRAIGRIFISTAAKEAPGGNVVPRIHGQKSEWVDRKWQRNQMPGDNKQKADSMWPGQSPRYSTGKRIRSRISFHRLSSLPSFLPCANFPSNPSPLINSSAEKGELTAAGILFPRKFLFPSRYTRFESRSGGHTLKFTSHVWWKFRVHAENQIFPDWKL